MATKRDRKTAFPFIKPKGSIKKDVQQYRKAVMSQNGDEEVRDAMINPVQRRESSAARFLKHFRPDRNNPAYHSEGKGLRNKRRHWNSERQLTPPEATAAAGDEAPTVASTCTASSVAPNAPKGGRHQSHHQPQRSHSFSEPDGGSSSLVRCNPSGGGVCSSPSSSSKEQQQHNGGGVRDSFRWRFRSSRSSSTTNAAASSSDLTSKDGDTRQKTTNDHTVLASSGDHKQKHASTNNGSNWLQQPSQQQAPNNGDDVEPIYINNNNNSSKTSSASSPTIQHGVMTSAGSTYSARVYAAAVCSAADADAIAESDYVNYEVFAAQLHKQQQHLEPDLLRNLPYQQQQQQQRNYNNVQQFSSPRRHANSRSGFSSDEQQQHQQPNGGAPPPVFAQRQLSRDAAGLHQPLQDRRLSSNSLTMQPYGPYSRPPAPLPDSALMDGSNSNNAASTSASWQWQNNHSNTTVSVSTVDSQVTDEDESHYASQLRSSMAALLQGHIRQSSTASNTSSTFSSYSDEFNGRAGLQGDHHHHHLLQQQQQQPPQLVHSPTLLGIPDMNGCYGGSPSSPPPPPPPVRDASSLKYVKYGPGHEKHPSWPMPGGGSANAQGQSQRSKSWTDHTDYPKEPAVTYSRPSNTSSTAGCSLSPSALTGGRAYSHQLKTVMENCERIPAEIYQATSVSVELDGTIVAPNYLPTYDCDGRNIDDKDYSIPSPPERDVSGPRMTMVGTSSSSSMIGGGGSGTGSAASSGDGGDYAKYEDIQQYSHSEGYSSYVPSESSYVSVSGTPLLDQLRRDSDGLGDNGGNNTKEPGTRDSVSTVVTHSSSSNSSNDTLRWHGSYNDITVASSGASGSGCVDTAASTLVVHSAKVQAPQRHNSESVLYYENQMTSSASSSSTIVTSASASAMKTINRHGGWSQRVERKNQWNANSNSSNRLSASGTYGSDQEACNTSPSSPNGAEPAPLSVAERIHQLEWQSRSVPNLSRSGNDSTCASPQRRTSAQPLALANGGHTISLDPVSPPSHPPSVTLSSSSSSPSPPSPERSAPLPVSSTDLLPQGGQVDPTQKYTFLDPDKRMRVADPTLKAIQKQALLSYYERHAGRSSMANKSPPPPALPRTSSSSSSNNMTGANNNSHPLKNDVPGAGVGGGAGASGGGHGSSHSPELGSNAALVAAVAAAIQSESSSRNGLQQQQRSGPIPPERPPKKPHLRNHQPAVSPDQETRRIESFSASQEQLNLPSQRSSVASSSSSALPVAATRRKPPAPDPPCSPPKIASSGVPLRSATPDLPPPPPPTIVTEELVTDDPLPPPPPSIVLDEATVNHQSSSSSSSPAPASPLPMYHQESYMVHRAKLRSPTGNQNYHRRSSDNLLAETSATPSSWEKLYNVRQNSASTTLIFSSTEALDRNGDDEQHKPQPQQRKSSPTFQTAQPQEPTNRPLSSNTNAERFAFMRQVSQGRPSTSASNGNSTVITTTTNSKLSDPGPPKSLLELNGNHRAIQHQRSHSDSDSPVVQPPLPSSKPPQVTSAPLPQRLKRPEEVECDQLSQDLIGHLPPSDSRLHALLSVPDPANAAASLRTEGLLQVQLGSASVQQESTSTSPTPSLKPPSPPATAAASASSTSPIKSNSCAPLPATSAYFTTSEPRAKLLTRYHSGNHILNNNNDDGNNSTTGTTLGTATTAISSAFDSDLLIKKKEELVSRLARKLDVLRSEREAIQEEVESNEQLGRSVTSRVSCVATPAETNKVFLHVAELDKITALLLALAGRLARAQNALHSLPEHSEPQEKIVLEGKRDKLMEQLEEAKRLKENIDRRSRQVADLLSRYLTEEEFADYSHFVTMKAKLVIDQREIDEKIKLGDEQLAALRETLHLGRPRI